jgi:hypothetical protein
MFISYGGGVQSTALIVLAIEGKIPMPRAALFSNVGDDSEHPKTLDYVRNIITPWAAAKGLPVLELHRTKKDGTRQSLWQRMMDHEGTSLREPIPVYGYTGAPMSRSCTADHKIKVLGKYIKTQIPKNQWPVKMFIGISVDEIQRANKGKNEPWEQREYPLLDLGLRRDHCEDVIKNAGLPVPPKSSCFFCPFHSIYAWQMLKQNEPVLFDKAVQLENKLNERRKNRGMQPVYLTKKGRSLDAAIIDPGPGLFDAFNDGGCDEGACWV